MCELVLTLEGGGLGCLLLDLCADIVGKFGEIENAFNVCDIRALFSYLRTVPPSLEEVIELQLRVVWC